MINNRLKYKRIYDRLMIKAKSRMKPDGYCERHHILPVSIGGTNSSENLVWLTAREHLIAHKLWARMEDDSRKRRKALNALWAMTILRSKDTAGRRIASSREYEQARKAMIEARTGVARDSETRTKISLALKAHFALNGCHNKGRSYDHLTAEERSRIFGAGNKGRIQSVEEREKRAQKLRKPRSEAARENIRLGALKREANKKGCLSKGSPF